MPKHKYWAGAPEIVTIRDCKTAVGISVFHFYPSRGLSWLSCSYSLGPQAPFGSLVAWPSLGLGWDRLYFVRNIKNKPLAPSRGIYIGTKDPFAPIKATNRCKILPACQEPLFSIGLIHNRC
jgi:hypothetical protein